jgi:hypothetical protein
MNWKEYQQQVQPGARIWMETKFGKRRGMAGRMFSTSGVEYIVRLDGDDGVLVIDEHNYHLIHLEELN